MKKNDWTRDEALAFVRKTRPEANPNRAFMARLLETAPAPSSIRMKRANVRATP